jgi:hypothetical protein
MACAGARAAERPGGYPSLRYPSLRYPSLLFPSLLFPSLRYPSLRYPSLLFPSLLFPSLRFPSLRYPSLLFPSLRYPSLRYPSLRYPSLRTSRPEAVTGLAKASESCACGQAWGLPTRGPHERSRGRAAGGGWGRAPAGGHSSWQRDSSSCRLGQVPASERSRATNRLARASSVTRPSPHPGHERREACVSSGSSFPWMRGSPWVVGGLPSEEVSKNGCALCSRDRDRSLCLQARSSRRQRLGVSNKGLGAPGPRARREPGSRPIGPTSRQQYAVKTVARSEHAAGGERPAR